MGNNGPEWQLFDPYGDYCGDGRVAGPSGVSGDPSMLLPLDPYGDYCGDGYAAPATSFITDGQPYGMNGPEDVGPTMPQRRRGILPV